MKDVIIPKHVFISYSHADKGFAEKIAADLEKVGISIWIDRNNLMPGNLNWNNTIIEELRHSFVVLLLASPFSGQSDVVQGEINVAKSLDCPIYPVWIRGKWEESIPLSMMNTQYIDCREDRYDTGLIQVIKALMQVIEAKTIKHFPYDKNYSYRIPEGYITITLDHENIVAMRPDSYDTLQSLLDDLYINYLENRCEPFTYGQEWVLANGFAHSKRLLVPWSWALQQGKHQPISRTNPSWQLSTPRTYGLCRWWDIIDTSRGFNTISTLSTYGIATNNENLGKHLLKSNELAVPIGYKQKFMIYLPWTLDVRNDKDDAYMKILPMKMLNPNDYEFLFVFATSEINMIGKVFIPGVEWFQQYYDYFKSCDAISDFGRAILDGGRA